MSDFDYGTSDADVREQYRRDDADDYVFADDADDDRFTTCGQCDEVVRKRDGVTDDHGGWFCDDDCMASYGERAEQAANAAYYGGGGTADVQEQQLRDAGRIP